MTQFARASLLAILCLTSALSIAEDTRAVTFNLPDHGKLLLAVPAAWNSAVSPRLGHAPPTMDLSQKSGPTFHIMLTPMWTSDSDTPLPDDASVREKVAAAAKEAEAQSVEPNLAVKELFGKANRGFYFSATDRAPKPDEWKYLTQGIIRIGGIDVAFSILTNDGQDSVIKSALGMLLAATDASSTV